MKKFENLILNSISEEITGTKIEKLMQVKAIFQAEKVYRQNSKPLHVLCQDWLQGLCSTVEIPYMNHEIIEWYEKELKRPIKEKEYSRLCDRYWENAGKTLYSMLYA